MFIDSSSLKGWPDGKIGGRIHTHCRLAIGTGGGVVTLISVHISYQIDYAVGRVCRRTEGGLALLVFFLHLGGGVYASSMEAVNWLK